MTASFGLISPLPLLWRRTLFFFNLSQFIAIGFRSDSVPGPGPKWCGDKSRFLRRAHPKLIIISTSVWHLGTRWLGTRAPAYTHVASVDFSRKSLSCGLETEQRHVCFSYLFRTSTSIAMMVSCLAAANRASLVRSSGRAFGHRDVAMMLSSGDGGLQILSRVADFKFLPLDG